MTSDASRAARAAGIVVASVVAIASSVEVARLSIFKRFSIDEFQYAHAAWLVSHSKLPYRDFFEFHFPLPYLSYSLFVNDSPGSIAHLRLFMLAVFALTSIALYRINRSLGPALALTAPIALATSAPFVFFATEIRPDSVAFGLFAAALSLLFPAPSSRNRALGAGALWVLALFATQKAIIYSAPLAVLLLVNAVRPKTRARELGTLLRIVLGGSAVALVIAIYFVVTHSGAAWFQQTLIWASFHEKRYPGFSWTVYGVPAFESVPVLVALGLWGVVCALIELKRSAEPLVQPPLILVLVLCSALFSFGFARAPFPYALLPGLGMLCAFVPRGCAALLRALRRSPMPKPLLLPATALALFALLFFGPRQGFADAEAKLAPDNAYQYRVLADVGRLTTITDPVYDNSGGYVARPHVGFRFYTSALDRQVEAAELPITVPRALREQGCTALLLDARFRGLPPPLIRFLTLPFQPYNADVWLWGQRFSSSLAPAEFEAVRDADYFVEPSSVATGGGFVIDGSPVATSVFHLSRGEHRVQYAGAARQFSVLWLPADKQRYRPKYGLRSEFSSIF